jgi:chemotaxis methyl-accepting protein methylase
MHHDTMRMSIFMDLVKQMSNTYVDEQSEQNYKCGWEIYTIVSFSYNDAVTKPLLRP